MPPWIVDWLSAERLASYRRAAGFDDKRALALYEWNSQANAALMHDFAHLEVGLRNLYSRGLMASLGPGERHWLEDAPLARLFPVHITKGRDANARSRAAVADARRRVSRPHLHGAVMAELTFGFWTMMTAKRLAPTIWPHLEAVLPPTTRREHVHATLEQLGKLRNRAAHHEPVTTSQLNDAERQMQRVASYVAPELATYLRAQSALPRLVANRP